MEGNYIEMRDRDGNVIRPKNSINVSLRKSRVASRNRGSHAPIGMRVPTKAEISAVMEVAQENYFKRKAEEIALSHQSEIGGAIYQCYQ